MFEKGDKLRNICCPGYDWEILDIDLDPDIIANYWGGCENPNCPKVCQVCDDRCMWDGVSSIDHDSIEVINER